MTKESSIRRTPKSVEDYLVSISDESRVLLEELRETIKEIIPDAEEVISYQIPTVRYQGRGLVAYSAHTKHCSLHIMSIAVTDLFKSKLETFTPTKATIHFTKDNRLPSTLVKKIIKARIKEVESKKKKA